MATNLAIDPELLERALAVSGERSKKAVSGSSSLGRRLVELFGQLDWNSTYRYKLVERGEALP